MKISFETAGWLNGKLIFPVWDYDAIFLYDIITDKIENYENYNLIVDRTPKMNFLAKSTPELILKRIYEKSDDNLKQVYARILEKF